MLFVNVLFSLFCYYPPNAFVLGDVRCKDIPARRKSSAGLVIYGDVYVGPIRPIVTGPLLGHITDHIEVRIVSPM